MLALLEVALALLLGAVTVEMGAVRPSWNAGVPRSVIVFDGSDQGARPVKPRAILCMLNRFLNATGARGRSSAGVHPAS